MQWDSRQTLRRRSLKIARAKSTAVAFLTIVAFASGDVSSASSVSSAQIAIHEQGTTNSNPKLPFDKRYPHGTFTIQLAGLTPNPAGTTALVPQPAQTRYVDGETQIPFVGSDTLTTKGGKLELAFKGVHIDVNSKLGSSGVATGPAAEYGTWTVRSGTGTFAGWKGGGVWAASIYGYGLVQPYSVEWDGSITR